LANLPVSVYQSIMQRTQQNLFGCGYAALGITDHNVCSWGCQASSCSTGAVIVLPGCEISVKHTTSLTDQVIHLLALFDPGTDSALINQVFSWSKCRSSEHERNEEYALNADLSNVVEHVRKLGGICIAAHVTSDRGLHTANKMLSFELLTLKDEMSKLKKIPTPTPEQRARKKDIEAAIRGTETDLQNQYLEFLIKTGISAVQISKPEHEKNYRLIHTMQVGGDAPMACILAPDSHRLCDICLPRYVTYIKMASPSVRGLSKAFNDPATRIRFNTTLPRIPYPRIRGLYLEGQDSFFTRREESDSLAVGFADNLTCIIGGRGSGKSCIIEGLRFALGRESVDIGNRRAGDSYLKYLSHLFDGTTLSLVYDCVGENTLFVKRTYGLAGAPVVEDPDGTQRHISTQQGSDIRIDIYGQSELEEVARDKATQRRLIDAIIPDSAQLSADINGINEKIVANTNLCVQKAKAIQRLNSQLQGLKDVKHQLDILQDPLLLPLIDQNGIAKQIDAFRLTTNDSIDKALSALQEAQQDISARQQKCSDLVESEVLDDPTFSADVKPTLSKLNNELLHLIESFGSLIGKVGNVELFLVTLNEKVQHVKGDIVERMQIAVSDQDSERLTGLIGKRQQLEAKYAELQPSEVERDQLLSDLWEHLKTHRRAFYNEREEKTKALFNRRMEAIQSIMLELESLPGRGLQVSISLQYQFDRSLFRKCLGENSGAPGYLKGNELTKHKFEGKWAKHFSEYMSSSDFANIIINRDKAGLQQIMKEDGSQLLSENHMEALLAERSPFSEADPYDIDPERLQNILDLADNGLAEDLPEITLAGRLVENLSPGQRCSALLPIILLSGDWPLVVDQPEDNLDNMHVFECLVEILRVLKHRRQIICATHNANIVVSGDAEQVIVCHGEDKDSGRILRQASIDDEDIIHASGNNEPGIVTYVKDIMEGGEQAFRTRARKYGLILKTDN